MKKLMVLVAALALVAGSALTVAAADWNFYGSARVATFYFDQENNVPETNPAYVDTSNYAQNLQSNARIGAKVKVSDELTGGFEYGTGVNVRLLYGEWNFGAGSLLIGQHYTPLNYFYSNQVVNGDNDMLGQGGVYSGREDMIRLQFGGFQVAVLGPNDNALGTGFGTEISMPGVEANYNMVMDAFSFNLGAGYQTYDLLGTPTGDQSVDSYVVSLGAKTGMGGFSIGGNVYMGENVGSMIAVDVDGDLAFTGDGYADYDGVNNKVIDNDAFGFILVATFKANDMFAFEAGYGYAEVEEWNAGTAQQVDNEVKTYYVQSTITLAPGVMIIPEIGMFDGEESNATSFETVYYGAKWQINF